MFVFSAGCMLFVQYADICAEAVKSTSRVLRRHLSLGVIVAGCCLAMAVVDEIFFQFKSNPIQHWGARQV
jgi:hypothetical protein